VWQTGTFKSGLEIIVQKKPRHRIKAKVVLEVCPGRIFIFLHWGTRSTRLRPTGRGDIIGVLAGFLRWHRQYHFAVSPALHAERARSSNLKFRLKLSAVPVRSFALHDLTEIALTLRTTLCNGDL
jgi:hypothetical protein